jgi:alpha-tubulin suppressor-like RCC1 family protein
MRQKKFLLFVVIFAMFFSVNSISWGQIKGHFPKVIGAGRDYGCAITQSGGVKCWGRNDAGQLGDKTNDGSNVPVDVSGLTSGVKAIAVGGFHACALTNTGAVKCWGGNSYGQLGDGTNKQSNIPVDVSGLSSGIIAIFAGVWHTCALTDTGAVKCWGFNSNYQLGDGTFTNRYTPVDVLGLSSGVKDIATGYFHTCVITQNGTVKCWGNNMHGQLGDGTNNNRNINTPVDVLGLSSGVIAIAAGDYHTCAITQNGAVKCWGSNPSGQLGNGTNNQGNAPVDVAGLSYGVKAIAVGKLHTCVVTQNGAAVCWGNNLYGQLGDGTNTYRNTPVRVFGLSSGVRDIAAGNGHTCAVTNSGAITCWGNNLYGQLGDGRGSYRNTPVDVSGLSYGVTAIAAGADRTCAITKSGAVKSWGSSDNVHLKYEPGRDRSSPGDIPGLDSRVVAIAPGRAHTCALTDSGAVKCWGDNDSGQLGDGTTKNRYAPVDVSSLGSGNKAIAAGDDHTCAITQSGAVKCWGRNNYEQLGDGVIIDRNIPSGASRSRPGFAGSGARVDGREERRVNYKNTPSDVFGLSSGVIAIAAGKDHTCALTQSGEVKCWGCNNYKLLGDGTFINRSTPVNVSGLSPGIKAIAAGGDHTCVLTNNGAVKCWGRSDLGELGDGTYTQKNTPVDVWGLNSGVTAIVAGESHTCALTQSGAVKCWGRNNYGQLGDGTHNRSNTPVAVLGLSSGVTAIASGANHTCALTQSGAVKCWGRNSCLQLGNGTFNRSNTPVDVLGF